MLLPAHPRHADPPHGADGRFYSSSSAGGADVPEHPSTPPDLRQCAHCGVVQSRWSSLYGQRFHIHALGDHVSHGICVACSRQTLTENLLPVYRRAGLTDAEATARIDVLVEINRENDAAREALDAQRLAHYQRDHPDFQPRARLADIRRRLTALQQATVTREGWNPQAQPRSHGKYAPSDPVAAAEAKAAKLLGGAGGTRTSGGKGKAKLSDEERQAHAHDRKAQALEAKMGPHIEALKGASWVGTFRQQEAGFAYRRAVQHREDVERSISHIRQRNDAYAERDLRSAQTRLRAAKSAEREAKDAWEKSGDPGFHRHAIGELDQQAAEHYAATDALRGGSGAVIHFHNEGVLSARAMFGDNFNRAVLARAIGAQKGDNIIIYGSNSEKTGDHMLTIRRVGPGGESDYEFTTSRGGYLDLKVNYVGNTGDRTAASGRDIIHGMQAIKALGVRYVTATAARSSNMNGYYTWARLGFRGQIPHDVLGPARVKFGAVSRVEQIMAKPGGARWWKDHGDAFEAKFDLRDNSPSMKVFQRFLRGEHR